MRNGQNNNNKQRMRGRNNHHSNNMNNNRRGQNPMTRVYESNGPEIKIRGTASHLAEKYVQLARDALGSGDPVSAENFYQHAEHYFRIIAAAQEQLRQNQPNQGQPQGDSRDEMGDDGDDFSNFGVEPGFTREQFRSAYQQQQPREHQQQRDQGHRDRNFRDNRQPREIQPPLLFSRPSSPAASRSPMSRWPARTAKAHSRMRRGRIAIRAAAAVRIIRVPRAERLPPTKPARAISPDHGSRADCFSAFSFPAVNPCGPVGASAGGITGISRRRSR